MLRLGILVDDLAASELTWRLVAQANGLMDAGRADVIFFVGTPGPIRFQPAGPVMNAAEAWGFTGGLVAVSLAGARRALAAPAPRARLYYLWDLDWARAGEPYAAAAAVHRDPRLALVPRTAWHKATVERCWNRPAAAPNPHCDLLALAGVLDGAD